MQWLIDGYNLMHATGAAGDPRVTQEGFRRRRRRFLSELAEGLGVRQARETTVVFDANTPPVDFELESSYKGIQVIFALGDENADSRIEQLIAAHSVPKSLTVVSSDRRIRQAAQRRKARALSSDQFLDLVDRLRTKRSAGMAGAREMSINPTDRTEPLSQQESDYWVEQFGDLDLASELGSSLTPDAPLLTDAEISRIQREVDGER
jgi:predicted RNA-binding protein with PIN domain